MLMMIGSYICYTLMIISIKLYNQLFTIWNFFSFKGLECYPLYSFIGYSSIPVYFLVLRGKGPKALETSPSGGVAPEGPPGALPGPPDPPSRGPSRLSPPGGAQGAFWALRGPFGASEGVF